MPSARPRARARRARVPPSLLAAGPPITPDYTDAFALEFAGTTVVPRDSLQWARAMLEGPPAPLRWLLYLSWRYLLRLRLAALPGPDGTDRDGTSHVLGWPVASTSAQVTVLAVSSPLLGQAQLVFDAGTERVCVATIVRFRSAAARRLWRLSGVVHRQAQPYLLTRAARRASH